MAIFCYNKKDMKKFWIVVVLIVIFGGLFFFRDNILDFYSRLSLKLPEIEKGVGDLVTEEIGKQILTPPPLKSLNEEFQSSLTREGVIEWTNNQREKYGLSPLKENSELDASATIKAEDMFKNQYFAHESLSGVGVGDLAKDVGYEFIAIGENLALGNFKNDEALVQAWMDSPGHRENILNEKYTEIGVAVMKGKYEGRITWMAVQHFGFPLSACSEPDQSLKSEIDKNQNQVHELESTLENLKSEIQNIRPRQRTIYLQKIEQYNNLVSQYNNLINETKILIDEYNAEVKTFNICASNV